MINSRCLVCNQVFKEDFNLERFLTIAKSPQRNSGSTNFLCTACRNSFKKIDSNRCPQCNRQQLDQTTCSDCKRWNVLVPPLLNHSVYSYTAVMHDLIRRYKRYGDYVIAQVLTDLVQLEFNKLISNKQYDYFVPLPTDPRHLQKRGFETINSIFEPLAPLTNALSKLPLEKPQSQKNRTERMTTKQTFSANPNVQLTGSILLLDDIYTTGRTMYHARDEILTQNPDCHIESFSPIR